MLFSFYINNGCQTHNMSKCAGKCFLDHLITQPCNLKVIGDAFVTGDKSFFFNFFFYDK